MVLAAPGYERGEHVPRGLIADARVPYGCPSLTEAILHAAWRRAGRSGIVLRSANGSVYRVLYPGRPAGGRGPDFVDAVIEAAHGSRLCGDIEIHVRPSDWRAHGHAADARYNGVLLHVALSDSGASAITSSGRAIPLLVMGLSRARAAAESRPAEGDFSHPGLPVLFLDLGVAGGERFANRSDGFAHDIQVLGADQAAYEGLMDCLGFPRNRAGFRRLARRLPWHVLRELAVGGSAGPRPDIALWIEDCLSWAAGFGPRPEGTPNLPGRAPEWTPQPGRPDNRPEKRVRGAASLLACMTELGGPAGYCISAAGECDAREIVGRFTAPARAGRALIGPGRAGEIVVNLVLPFAHAMAPLRGDRTGATRCLRLYREHPALPDNSLSRKAGLVLSTMIQVPVKPAAREQQGLIHIYRTMTSKIVRPRQLPLV